MNGFDATEIAYRNGYKKGFEDAKSQSIIICHDCVCIGVCSVFNATGGVCRCDHFHEKVRYTTPIQIPADEVVTVKLDTMCSRCSGLMLNQDVVCPGCGAIVEDNKGDVR